MEIGDYSKEGDIPTRINNKVKQFFSGSGYYGVDKFTKKRTTIKPFGKVPLGKKKKKVKKEFFWIGEQCPFCKGRLEKLEGSKKTGFFWSIFSSYVKECKCGAKEVEDCPCCHRETWFKDRIYKHGDGMGCGFTGEKSK